MLMEPCGARLTSGEPSGCLHMNRLSTTCCLPPALTHRLCRILDAAANVLKLPIELLFTVLATSDLSRSTSGFLAAYFELSISEPFDVAYM